jgi:hypothetical protein
VIFPAVWAHRFADAGGHLGATGAAPGTQAGVPLEFPLLARSGRALAGAVDPKRSLGADPGELLPALWACHLLRWMHPRHVPGFHSGGVALLALPPAPACPSRVPAELGQRLGLAADCAGPASVHL